MRARSAATLAILMTCACADDGYVVEPGVIDFYGARSIEVPSTASATQPFIVSIITYGGGCVSEDRTEVTLAADAADVEVYDRKRTGDGICTQILKHFPHPAAIVFNTTGAKELRIHGRRVDAGVDEMIEIPISIVVQ